MNVPMNEEHSARLAHDADCLGLRLSRLHDRFIRDATFLRTVIPAQFFRIDLRVSSCMLSTLLSCVRGS